MECIYFVSRWWDLCYTQQRRNSKHLYGSRCHQCPIVWVLWSSVVLCFDRLFHFMACSVRSLLHLCAVVISVTSFPISHLVGFPILSTKWNFYLLLLKMPSCSMISYVLGPPSYLCLSLWRDGRNQSWRIRITSISVGDSVYTSHQTLKALSNVW